MIYDREFLSYDDISACIRFEDNTLKRIGVVPLKADPHVDMSGNSYIHGMLMMKESTVADGPSDRELKISGNGTVKYSSEAVQMVNNTWSDVLPAKLVSWKEDF